MTKKELLEKLADMYDKVQTLEVDAESVKGNIKDLREMLEDIPERTNEITEDKESE